MSITKIIPLSEGLYTVGSDKVFHIFNDEEHALEDRSRGSLLVEVQPFLIINDKDIILLDTGLGFSKDYNLILVENLLKHQVHTEDVTKILISHLHKDHSGGLYPELFPNAEIFISKNEYDYAIAQGMPSYDPSVLSRLTNASNIHWLEKEEGVIDHYIHYIKTGGHSKEHIVFKIEDEDGVIFFGGDEAPQLKQLKVRYKAKYDFDGQKAMDWRANWAEEGKKASWTFLFYHDYKNPKSTL